MSSLIIVTVKQSSTRWPIRRPQRWYWTAIDGVNNEKLARSSEMYTNPGAAIAAAELVFGLGSDVLLRTPTAWNVKLRDKSDGPKS